MESPHFSLSLTLYGGDISILPGLEAYLQNFVRDAILRCVLCGLQVVLGSVTCLQGGCLRQFGHFHVLLERNMPTLPSLEAYLQSCLRNAILRSAASAHAPQKLLSHCILGGLSACWITCSYLPSVQRRGGSLRLLCRHGISCDQLGLLVSSSSHSSSGSVCDQLFLQSRQPEDSLG